MTLRVFVYTYQDVNRQAENQLKGQKRDLDYLKDEILMFFP